MNTKGNQRSRDTRRAIQDAFVQLLAQQSQEQITVTQLCRRAGVHRTTFYHHYQDVPQLMEEMIREEYQEILAHFNLSLDRRPDLEEGLISMLELVKANPVFFLRVLDHQRAADVGPGLDLPPEYLAADTPGQEYLRGGFRAAMGNMVRRWLEHGCDLPVEEMALLIHAMFPWK